MRVIAGSRRRTNLITPEGLNTRPTLDRQKETLFNMIGPDIVNTKFLDIFSGSGQIGIEALSRGALSAVFIESDVAACKCIKENLKKCRFEEEGRLYSCNYKNALSTIKETFDFVFMDPPYDKELEKQVLTDLVDSTLINADTVIIIEASLQTDFSYLNSLGYELIKEKSYKTNKHIFVSLLKDVQ